MVKGLEKTFHQRRYTNGQKAQKKLLNITNHQGNESQSHSKISPHIGQKGHYKKKKERKEKIKEMFQ